MVGGGCSVAGEGVETRRPGWGAQQHVASLRRWHAAAAATTAGAGGAGTAAGSQQATTAPPLPLRLGRELWQLLHSSAACVNCGGLSWEGKGAAVTTALWHPVAVLSPCKGGKTFIL